MSIIKVLYAEDEIFLGKIVKETLESRGFQVIMETNGDRVLKAFETGKPDICVLDIMMPNRNGYEVAEDIRAVDADVPIIFLTAKTQTEDLVRGFRTGGNDYIRKPFSMEELIVRIENALRVRRNKVEPVQMPESIVIGQYSFHLNRQVLVFGESERKLSYRESELLKQLWQFRDRIIDREEILQAIWGNDSFLNSRNLDVYITRLRNYLKEDEGVEILTIKGIGYRFVLP
jgi:DNA-binding response OmpR family regulator